MSSTITTEHQRLEHEAARTKNWKRWGPYLSERQWATVREDYSPYGNCWDYFPHDHARSRAYRWGEDGLLGITDRFPYPSRSSLIASDRAPPFSVMKGLTCRVSAAADAGQFASPSHRDGLQFMLATRMSTALLGIWRTFAVPFFSLVA